MRSSVLLCALLLGGCSAAPTEPAPSTPATTPETTPARPTAPAAGDDVATLPLTGRPRVGWVDDHVLRLPGGRTVDLPGRWATTSITPYAGGWLVTDDRFFEGTVGMHRLDGDGRVLASWATTGAALPNRDGRVAWVSVVASESGREGPTLLHVDSVEGGAERTQQVEPGLLPFLTRWSQGRLVYRTWGRRTSFDTDLVSPPRAVPLAQDLGVRSPDGRSWALPTAVGLEVRQSDGQLLQLVRARGLDRSQLAVLSWEDDDTVLLTLTRGRLMCLARVDVDSGRLSRATAWRRQSVAGFALLPAR